VATVHYDLRDDRGWLALRYGLPRYREAAAIHCLNQFQKSVLEAHGIGRAEIIPHGVDRRLFPVPARPRRWPGERLRLGFFSRRYARGMKGESLFQALLTQLDPHRVAFVLVGDGREEEARLVREKGFPVQCWGRLPYLLMPEVYDGIDALLILSPFEGGPASLPEALGSGVPVFSLPVGMCPEFVQDEANGLILSGRPEADGPRILSQGDNAGAGIARLNDGAFAAAARIPSWETVMTRWYGLYDTVLEVA
jgi:glycosyltransferase involved in cell wall biosynthesis